MGLLSKVVVSLGNVERVVNAFHYSAKGLRYAVKNEAAFRQEVALFVILAPLGFWLGNNAVERSLLVGVLVLVMIVELLNSAVEATVDRISKKHHKLSGRAKDMGSAAVLFAIFLALLTWGSILYEHWNSGAYG